MTAGEKCDYGCSRRVVLGTALGLVPWWATKSNAEGEDPTEILPQVGDHFVYLTGPMEGQVVKTADLTVGPQVQAYPADPSGRVRDGSRLGRSLYIPKHRGSACSKRSSPTKLTSRG